jgi:hypothetical protein
MNDIGDRYPDYLAGSDLDGSAATSVAEMEDRIAQLEEQVTALSNQLQGSHTAGIGFYGLGTIIAVVLSWSRNASIPRCILHGIFSWIYVVYFAFPR